MKKFLLIFGLLALATLLVIGGCTVNKKAEKEDLIKIVKSEEAQKVFKEGLKNLDPKALTEEGIIKSYKIDYNSIKKNPMGGILVTTYINNDKKLSIIDTLNKNYSTNKLEIGGSVISEELDELLGGQGANLQNKKENLFEIVKSDEAKNLFEKRLKRIDPKAFTDEGIIKSYKIDESSVEKHPMGGVLVSIYVNDNKEYRFSFTLNKDLDTGELYEEGGGNNSTIIQKVEERDKKQN